jgi:para-nitrobenzyl esterase
MVWFHGSMAAGLFSGESNDYDGSKLARRGNVVVVTINYRVGALGFFSHPAINAEGHPYANYGIMEQQFALLWVKGNIAAFGGDPGNVTSSDSRAGAPPLCPIWSRHCRGNCFTAPSTRAARAST